MAWDDTKSSGELIKSADWNDMVTDQKSRIPSSSFAAKGDILVGTGSGTFTNLTVGADNTVLVADSTQTSGAKWSKITKDNLDSLDSPADGEVLSWNATSSQFEWVEQSGGGSSDSINVETLTGNKTLVAGTDAKYQWLDCNGANRTITLDTSSASNGDIFVIKNNTSHTQNYYLLVNSGTTTIDRIYPHSFRTYIFDGTDWTPADTEGSDYNIAIGKYSNTGYLGVSIGHNTNSLTKGVAVGYNSYGYTYGVGVGYQAQGYSSGVGVGYQAYGSNYGAAVGQFANATSYGVAIGYNAKGYSYGVAVGNQASTNGKYYSIALGYRSKCHSYGQTAINIDTDFYKRQHVSYRLTVQTTDATQTEMWAAGTSGYKISIRAQSHFAFKGIIVARNDANNEGMAWEIKGMIKRDGSNNTSLVGTPTITEIAKDGSLSWSISVEADDTNEALVIKVTGESGKTIRWAGVIEGVEVIV